MLIAPWKEVEGRASAPDSLRAVLRQRDLPVSRRVVALEGLCRLYGTPGLDADSALLYGEQAAALAWRTAGVRPQLLLDVLNTLGTLLDNLLNWGRAQAGQVMNHPTAVEAAQIAATALALHRPTATNRRIQLVAELPPGLPPVWVDPALLGTVLRNLVGNAVKFTPAGGAVTVRLTADLPGFLRFTVTDTGVGIAPEQLATLFEPGRARSTSDATTGEVGTGLGLAVCRSFVRLLGGELRASSRPGQWAAFTFDVPVAQG